MNFKELISYRSHSRSVKQYQLRTDLQKEYGGTVDVGGNLIITKGSPKVAIVAHLDINQKVGVPSMSVENGLWFSTNGVGAGFDDKAGVFFALEMLKKQKDIQIILTIDEEIGCVGASKVVLDSNIQFLIQLDRRGNSDISDYTNSIEVVNPETKSLFDDCLSKNGFKWVRCVYTDIGEIAGNNKVQAVNISTGYYNEHSGNEYLNISEFKHSCKFANAIFEIANSSTIEPLDLFVDDYDVRSLDAADSEDGLYYFLETLSQSQIEDLKKNTKILLR